MCAFYIPDFQQHLPVLYLKTFAFVSIGLKCWDIGLVIPILR